MPRRFAIVALGGTFDHLHKGHMALLKRAFEVGELVVIGVTSDEFAKRLGKTLDHPYEKRVEYLKTELDLSFPGRRYEVYALFEYFGPAVFNGRVDALVVSKETSDRVKIANDERKRRGFPPLETVIVDWVLSEDGLRISSTRIRKGEIDKEGRLLRK